MHNLILAAVLLLSSTFVQAQSFRDWKVVTETDAVLQVPVCRAFTQISSNLPIPVELSLSFPTAFDKVPTMILKVPANSQIQQAVVPLSSRENEDFLVFQQVTDPSQQDKLWYVPVQMEKMVDIIIGNNNLPLKFTLANKEESGRISLAGSTAALNQIARCLRVTEILPKKFFKELNTAAGAANLGPDQTVAQLMIYVDQAFAHFREIAKTDADLAKLRQNMRPLLTQETDAQNKFNTAQANLDRATNTMNATAEKIRVGEERLQKIPGEIQALQAQRPAADQKLAEKKALFDPLHAEKNRLQGVIDRASSEVDSARWAINNRENLISTNERKVRDLQYEATNLDREVDNIDRELSRLERRKSELESDLSAYNVELEKQKILNNSHRYQQLKNEKAGLPQQIRQKRQELNQAQNRLQRAEEALRRCRGNSTTPNCDPEKQRVREAEGRVQTAQDKLNRCQNGSFGGNDCRDKERAVRQAENQVRQAENALNRCQSSNGGIGTPGNPGQRDCSREKENLERERQELARAQQALNECLNNRPNCDNERRELRAAEGDLNAAKSLLQRCLNNVVVPRCEAEENEVNSARREVNQTQSELNQLESRLNSIDSEISRIESDAHNQAVRGHEVLAEELRRVAREVSDKRLEKERAQDRIREINNSEIPRLQQEISRAQSELPGLRRDLADAERDLSNAQAEMRRWKTSVDYDRVEREYLAAKKAVDDIVNGIAALQTEQTQINRNLPTWRTQLTQQTAEVNRLTPLRDTAKTKLDGIQAQLQPMRDQEKNMTDLLATLKPAYEELRKLYQTLAKHLLGP